MEGLQLFALVIILAFEMLALAIIFAIGAWITYRVVSKALKFLMED